MMQKLELGPGARFEVREVSCLGGAGSGFRVLYLSDLHLTRWGGPLVEALLTTITQLDPTLIVLGGDYVDGRRGLPHFERLLALLATRPHVYVVAGNHDVWFGLAEIRRLVEAYHLTWLTDDTRIVELPGCRVQLSGCAACPRAADIDFSIVCLHEPSRLPSPAVHDLVLAGHLHGGQVVLWRTANGLYPGRLFYPWNILQARLGRCLYVVSKGLGDTLPIRYNCPKDVVLVSVGPASPN